MSKPEKFKLNYYRHGDKLWRVQASDREMLTKHVVISVPTQTMIIEDKAYIIGEGKIFLWNRHAVVIG